MNRIDDAREQRRAVADYFDRLAADHALLPPAANDARVAIEA